MVKFEIIFVDKKVGRSNVPYGDFFLKQSQSQFDQLPCNSEDVFFVDVVFNYFSQIKL